MDPLADKLLVTAALISLVQMELAPAWMVAVILGREFSVTVLQHRARAGPDAASSSPIGKVKMVAQVVAILVLIPPPPNAAVLHRRQDRAVGRRPADLGRGLLSPINALLRPAARRPGPVLASSREERRARSGQCLILIVAIRALAFCILALRIRLDDLRVVGQRLGFLQALVERLAEIEYGVDLRKSGSSLMSPRRRMIAPTYQRSRK